MKKCLVYNHTMGTMKEYVYVGVRRGIDHKGNIKYWHIVKDFGQGNKRTHSILVGSKTTNVYIEQ